MSAVAARGRAPAEPRTAAITDRLLAAIPLLTIFFWLALLYCWESWGHLTPWLFTDELETAQLSRSIADTGFAARRGVPHGFQSLYNYLIAPGWWYSDMETAYATVKYIGAVTMTVVVFPTYWLARMVVSKPWALLAAATAAAAPALVYSSFLIEEPLAYPYATFCFFAIAKALATRERRWIVGAVVASVGAPAVRGQLAVIPGVLLLAALFRWWGSERARAWRNDWTAGDWLGAATLAAGAVIFLNAFISHHSYAWLISTLFYKGRMIEYGLWAAGALTIGLGVFPVVAGLTALFPPRGLGQSENERGFRAVAFAAIGLVGFYTAVKAAYVSTVFSTLVEERNMIYVGPLLVIGTVLVLERGRVRLLPVAGAAAFVLYLILSTPYRMEFHFYFDAPGLGILQAANQKFGWTPGYAQNVLLGMLVVSVALLALPHAIRWMSPRPLTALAVAVGLAVFTWNITAQITSAISSKYFAELFASNIDKPWDWLDQTTHGAPTIYLGQNITDPTGVQELEFWNRSIRWMWSLDGSAIRVGSPVLTPDFAPGTGRLTGAGTATTIREAQYVAADQGVDIVGRIVAKHRHLVGGGPRNWVLWKIDRPLRLSQAASGLSDDGWMSSSSPDVPARAAYSRFTTPGMKAGYAWVSLARSDGFDFRSNVVVKVGKLVVNANKQPGLGRVTEVQRTVAEPHSYKMLYLRTPKPPFRVTVSIDPTFTPQELDPRSSDIRHLGAQVSFGFVERIPPAKPAG